MKRNFFCILVLAVALQIGLRVRSCICEPVLLQDAIAKSDMIFSGKVIEISGYGIDGKNTPPRMWQVRIRVVKGWKGVNSKEVTVLTASGPSCGYGFQVDKEYLVYSKDGGVSICFPTKLLEKADEDLKILVPPTYIPK